MNDFLFPKVKREIVETVNYYKGSKAGNRNPDEMEEIRHSIAERAGVIYYLKTVKKCSIGALAELFELTKSSVHNALKYSNEILEGDNHPLYNSFSKTYTYLIDKDPQEEEWKSSLDRKKYKRTMPEETKTEAGTEVQKPEPAFVKESSRDGFDFYAVMDSRKQILKDLEDNMIEVKNNIDFILADIQTNMEKWLNCLKEEYGNLRVKELEMKQFPEGFIRRVEIIKAKIYEWGDYFAAINCEERTYTVTSSIVSKEIDKLSEEFFKLLEKIE